jgi:hypothetical protein
MKNEMSSKTFVPKIDNVQSQIARSRQWRWVSIGETAAGFYLASLGMHLAVTNTGWKALLGGLLVLGIPGMFAYHIQTWIWMEREQLDRSFHLIQRKLVEFTCRASLGFLEKDELKRLITATQPKFGTQSIMADQWQLIMQPDEFWDGNGFFWQNHTECVNCNSLRMEHDEDGQCPSK